MAHERGKAKPLAHHVQRLHFPEAIRLKLICCLAAVWYRHTLLTRVGRMPFSSLASAAFLHCRRLCFPYRIPNLLQAQLPKFSTVVSSGSRRNDNVARMLIGHHVQWSKSSLFMFCLTPVPYAQHRAKTRGATAFTPSYLSGVRVTAATKVS